MEATSEGAPGTAEAPPVRRSRLWLRAAVAVGAILFVALLAYGVARDAPQDTIDESLARGESVTPPRFELPVLQPGEPGAELGGLLGRATADGRVSLEELRGTPLVINFWASWCEPCRTEAPLLEERWRTARGGGVAFVGLNMQDLTGDARRFVAEFDTSYLNVRDESNGVALDWGVTGLPETFFVGADGQVVAHVIGAISAGQLARGLEAAEAGRPLGSLEGGDRRSVR